MIGHDCYEVEEQHHHAAPHDLYPTWTYRRGEAPTEESYFAEQDIEVHRKPRIGGGPRNGTMVDVHRIAGATLDPGRVLTHPSR